MVSLTYSLVEYRRALGVSRSGLNEHKLKSTGSHCSGQSSGRRLRYLQLPLFNSAGPKNHRRKTRFPIILVQIAGFARSKEVENDDEDDDRSMSDAG
jgi:hypothetical protein